MRGLWAAGAAIVVCLALGGLPAAGQEASPATTAGVGNAWVTGSMECTGTPPMIECDVTASDPRLAGRFTETVDGDCYPLTPSGTGCATVIWGTFDGPGWSGSISGTVDPAGHMALCFIETGTGTNSGWTFIGSLTETGDFSGPLYQGPPPALPLPSAASEPAASPSPAPSALATIGRPADDGARIVAVEALDARTRDLTIESPSVGTVKVRLLLPAAFDAQPDARWPVLYLLQGCCDTYDSWTRETDVEELTAPTDLLVVMPAATRSGDGGFGWYTDWYNGGQGGQPAWETFHLTELRQLLERDWQAGDDRVIAGLSMGGYGAMAYAARHPGMFKAAASYHGLVDLADLPFDPDPAVFGPRDEQADVWAAHDPMALAPALAGIALYVAYGNGEPGPLDPAGTPFDDTEAAVAPLNDAFVARLEELGIPATVNAYGPGTHTWPYRERELHASLPMLLEALGEPPLTAPASEAP